MKKPSDLYEKSAVLMLKQLDIESEMKTRPHTFTCGTNGEVVDEIIIKIKHKKDLNVQPHSGYEEVSVDFFTRSYLNNQLQPWLENIDERFFLQDHI